MWPVIRRNVRAAPDRDVEGSPATPKFPPLLLRAANQAERDHPGKGTAPTGHNFTAWTYLCLLPEWSAAPVAPSLPTGRYCHRWFDGRRIPPARCPRAPQAREIPPSGAGRV
jgi:hypothetical protein